MKQCLSRFLTQSNMVYMPVSGCVSSVAALLLLLQLPNSSEFSPQVSAAAAAACAAAGHRRDARLNSGTFMKLDITTVQQHLLCLDISTQYTVFMCRYLDICYYHHQVFYIPHSNRSKEAPDIKPIKYTNHVERPPTYAT